jgi:ribosomal protein L25 (general stress protein Ctc)
VSAARQEEKVEVFSALSRLLHEWRDDPDRLAVASEAWRMAGYTPGWEADEARVALDVVIAARHRKNRRLLRHRARGLLLALEATARDANRALLHDVQVDAAVIECRHLPLDERLAKLREPTPDRKDNTP